MKSVSDRTVSPIGHWILFNDLSHLPPLQLSGTRLDWLMSKASFNPQILRFCRTLFMIMKLSYKVIYLEYNKNQEITKTVKKEMEAGILMPVRK